MFKATIFTARRIILEAQVKSVFLPGETGEFEVLEFHKAIVSRLKAGDIVIDWDKRIPIKSGVVRMRNDELAALVEE